MPVDGDAVTAVLDATAEHRQARPERSGRGHAPAHPRAAAIVAAARACVGTRTRAQGRVPGLALDCLGVVAAAARSAGVKAVIPSDYALGGANAERVAAGLAAAGCRCVATAAAGDIIELEVAPGQRHLAVLCGASAVHAHFGVGRVVEAPLPDDWRVIAIWRLPEGA